MGVHPDNLQLGAVAPGSNAKIQKLPERKACTIRLATMYDPLPDESTPSGDSLRDRERLSLSAPPPLPVDSPSPPQAAPIHSAAASPAMPPAVQPPVRDRIVVLGRRRAGKTVFLARMYERLWNSTGHLHMAAVDGQSHLALIRQLDAIQRRTWPASTESISHLKLEVSFKNQRYLMVTLDYPGEVFRRAFMEESDEPAVRELLGNLDRAAAAIVLVDPGVRFEGDLMEHADQDFGLVAAINRIRSWPGAESIPIALAVTKCDRYRTEIEAQGGLALFVKNAYTNLYRAALGGRRRGMIFACAAISSQRDGLGNDVPDPRKPPRGVVESLEYCLEGMSARRMEREREAEAQAQREHYEQLRQVAAEADQSMSRLTLALVGGGVGLLLLTAIIMWIVLA